MSEGFGSTRDKRLLTKRIQGHDINQVHKLMDQFAQRLTPLQIDSLVSETLEALPKEEGAWFYKNLLDSDQYRQMQDLAAEGMTQLLIEAGFVSGTDFCSNPNGGIILSHEASERILAEIPEMDGESFDAAFITVGEVISM